MRGGRRLAVVAVLAAALGAAACGSDDDGSAPSVTFADVTTSATGATTAATTAPAATDAASGASAAPTTAAAGTPATVATTTGATSSTVAPTAPAGATPSVQLTELAEADAPTGIAVRPGDQRLFVVGRAGTIVPIGTDGTVGEPVLDITSLVQSGGEQGLLGLAFHPTEPFAYVDYTGTDDGTTHIAEVAVAADGTMDRASLRELLAIDQPYSNHNGGQLAFGPDGMLYIGMGDGGAGGDPERRGLDVRELLGKILRIDPRASGSEPYTVPDDNPFVGTAGARPEIWSVGLRNPWRFSFDPSTNDLWIADVGQGEWEEVDVAWADQGGGRGWNFGWSAFEGSHRFNTDQPEQGAVPPIYEYSHDVGGCSISGGALYRGAVIPALDGWYVYGDYCAGEVRALQIVDRAVTQQVVLGEVASISSVAAGPDGELYVTSVDGNRIYRVG